jgi:hypothetical protein
MDSSYIMTISDLMTTQAVISQRMMLDTAALQPLANPSTNNLTPVFMKWAAAGFPPRYTLLNMEFSPLGVGPNRPNTYDYATQLLGTDLSQAVASFGSNFQGMSFSFIPLPNSVLIQVSKTD